MTRIKLIIEYDGARYAGWQRQDNAVSVQQRLEEAIHKITGTDVGVTGASRTDAGVHALGQTVHFDTTSRIQSEKFAFALNTALPRDIRVSSSETVDDTFHARFSAKGKLYRYMYYNRRHASALTYNTHWHVPLDLNADAMRRVLPDIIGTHDFRSCMASGGSSKDTVRSMSKAELEVHNDEIAFYIEGNGFLYHMVRTLAGTLCQIGLGKLPETAIRDALQSGDRLQLGVTAPAHGLTLMRVYY